MFLLSRIRALPPSVGSTVARGHSRSGVVMVQGASRGGVGSSSSSRRSYEEAKKLAAEGEATPPDAGHQPGRRFLRPHCILSLLPHLLIKPSFRFRSRKGFGRDGGIKVYAVLRGDGAEFAKNNNLEALFHVDDLGPRVPIKKGKLLDVNQALEVVRFDIQYCDWRV